MKKKHLFILIAILMAAFGILALAACGEPTASAEYDQQAIRILFPDGTEKKLTLAEMKTLEQHEMHGDCIRTTGTIDEYDAKGAYLRDILALAGADIDEYEGVSITGRDGYYCLFSREILAQPDPETLIAFVLNGKAELEKEFCPAMVVAQGLFGPYWVKMVDEIILLDNIPEKEIVSVWSFHNLTRDITPFKYEYWGSQDDAIDLEQVWARLDNVDTSAFFTMKSSDGFTKNEAMNMVLKRYYIKTTGIEAPTNINPNIALGMNVQYIAWFSANADACIFPEEMEKFMTIATDGDIKGVAFDDILTETQAELYPDTYYEIIGLDGTSRVIKSEELEKAILYIAGEKQYNVHFVGNEYEEIKDFLRIRLSDKESYDAQFKQASDNSGSTTAAIAEKTTLIVPEKTVTDTVPTAPVTPPTYVIVPEPTTAAPSEEKTGAVSEPYIPSAPATEPIPPTPATEPAVEKTTVAAGSTVTVEPPAPKPLVTTPITDPVTTAVNTAVEVTIPPSPTAPVTAPAAEEPKTSLPADIPAPQAGEEIIIEFSGNGLEYNIGLTLSQLKSLKEGYVEGIYSTRNNYPTNKKAVAKGIDMLYLLDKLGLKEDAASITFTAYDGYYATLPIAQLEQDRYYFPDLAKDSKANAVKMPAVLAWAYKSGSDKLDKAKEEGELTFLIAQRALKDMNTASAVQGLVKIEVTAESQGAWSLPQIKTVDKGDGNYEITLISDEMDMTKYYYTTDGSEPTIDCPVYNPSTSAFQPKLTVPLQLKGGTTLKILAAALGKADSEVLTEIIGN